MVVNGATKFGDMAHFKVQMDEFKAAGGDVDMQYFHERNLVALQGPGAQRVLSALIPSSVDLSSMPFMSCFSTDVAGVPCGVTRCGYTGEDGFEVSMEWHDAHKVAAAMLEEDGVLPAGLGARDRSVTRVAPSLPCLFSLTRVPTLQLAVGGRPVLVRQRLG